MKQLRFTPKTCLSGQHTQGHTAGDTQQDTDVSWGRDESSLCFPEFSDQNQSLGHTRTPPTMAEQPAQSWKLLPLTEERER